METSRRRYCSAFGCLNSTLTKPMLSFFTLPKNAERRTKWLQLISREDLANRPYANYTVCEEHFNAQDIMPGPNRKILKMFALPSLRLLMAQNKKEVGTQTQTHLNEDSQPEEKVTELTENKSSLPSNSSSKRKLNTELSAPITTAVSLIPQTLKIRTMQVCRTCLAHDLRMCNILGTPLQKFYENTANIKINTEAGRPFVVCYICYHLLKKCLKFTESAIKANEMLREMGQSGIKITKDYFSKLQRTFLFTSFNKSSVTHVNADSDSPENNVFEVRHEYENLLDLDETDKKPSEIAVNALEIPKDDSYLRWEIKQEIIEEKEKLSLEDPLRSQNHYEDVKMEIILDTDEQGNKAEDESGVRKETGNPLHIQVYKDIEARYTKEEGSSKEAPQSPDQSLDSGYNVPLENDSFITENVEIIMEVCEDHRQGNEVGASRSKEHELQKNSESSKRTEVSTSVKGNVENTNKQDSRNIDPKRKIPCDYCDFKTTYKCEMKIHLRSHTGERPFPCNYCDQRFSYQNNLFRHLRGIHKEYKALSCEYCEKKFRMETYLTKHIITVHTGQRRFICGYCDKVFTMKSNLSTHIRTHTGEKPFVCTICDKHVTSKHSLLKHLKTHANPPRIKPFTCSYCEKQFTLNKNFRRHLRVFHNVHVT